MADNGTSTWRALGKISRNLHARIEFAAEASKCFPKKHPIYAWLHERNFGSIRDKLESALLRAFPVGNEMDGGCPLNSLHGQPRAGESEGVKVRLDSSIVDFGETGHVLHRCTLLPLFAQLTPRRKYEYIVNLVQAERAFLPALLRYRWLTASEKASLEKLVRRVNKHLDRVEAAFENIKERFAKEAAKGAAEVGAMAGNKRRRV